MSETCFESTHPLFHLTKSWWYARNEEWVCDVSKTICWKDVSKTNCWRCFQNLSWMIFSKIFSWVIFLKSFHLWCFQNNLLERCFQNLLWMIFSKIFSWVIFPYLTHFPYKRKLSPQSFSFETWEKRALILYYSFLVNKKRLWRYLLWFHVCGSSCHYAYMR